MSDEVMADAAPDAPGAPEETSEQTSNTMIPERVAQARWGRMGGYPWWPCVSIPRDSPNVPNKLQKQPKSHTFVRFPSGQFFSFRPEFLQPWGPDPEKAKASTASKAKGDKARKVELNALILWLTGQSDTYLVNGASLDAIPTAKAGKGKSRPQTPPEPESASEKSDNDSDAEADREIQKKLKEKKKREQEETKAKKEAERKAKKEAEKAKKKEIKSEPRPKRPKEEDGDELASAPPKRRLKKLLSSDDDAMGTSTAALLGDPDKPIKKRKSVIADSDSDTPAKTKIPKIKLARPPKLKHNEVFYTDRKEKKLAHTAVPSSTKPAKKVGVDITDLAAQLVLDISDEKQLDDRYVQLTQLAQNPASSTADRQDAERELIDVKKDLERARGVISNSLNRISLNLSQITLENLKTTGLGKTVMGLRKHKHKQLGDRATDLGNKLKKIAEELALKHAQLEAKNAHLVDVQLKAEHDGSVSFAINVVMTSEPAAAPREVRTESGSSNPVVRKLVEKLSMKDEPQPPSLASLSAEQVEEIAIEINDAIQQVSDSTNRARSIIFNLGKNVDLREVMLSRSIPAARLAKMPVEDMASASLQQHRRQIQENKMYHQTVAKQEATTDQFKCGKCQQRKTTFYQLQTRSADEPMTTFVTCVNCGNRWKFC